MLAATALSAAVQYHQAVGVPPIPLSANVCGSLAGLIGVSTSWPQAWRLWVGRRHAGLSLSANVLGLLYSIAWLLYGVLSHSAVQTLASAIGTVGSLVVLGGHLYRARIPVRAWLPSFTGGLVVIGAAFAGGRAAVGLTAAVATVAGVIPQVVVLARARRAGHFDARGVSRARWLLSAGCNALWLVYGVIVSDDLIAVNSCLIGALGVAIVLLTIAPTHPMRPDAAAQPSRPQPGPAVQVPQLA